MFGLSRLPGVLAARRRVFRWILAAGVLVAALVAAVAVVPLLLNGEAAKDAIERQLTALTGGDFRYATLELTMWPRPTAELRQATFRVAPVVEGTVERMVFRFAFLRLLVGDVHVSSLRLERPALVVRLPAADLAPMPDDPVTYYRNAFGPGAAWLSRNASGLALSVRDGTVDLDAQGAPPFKLDAFTLDGRVSSDAIEVKIAAHANLWQEARASAQIATDSLAAKVDLEIEGADAVSTLEHLLPPSPVRWYPGTIDAKLVAETDGERSATGELTVAMPALGISRNGARLDMGQVEARLAASHAPGDTRLQVKALKLGDLLPAATGSVRMRPGTGGTVLDATLGRVDAGRVLAGAIKIADDVPLVRAVAAIVKGGVALDVKVAAVVDDAKRLADPSAYDVSMGVEDARIDVPIPAMSLSGAAGKVQIARDVLTARGVAATFGGSTLTNGDMVLALAPSVALRSVSMMLDLDLAENHMRVAQLLRGSPLATEFGRVESIAGRAKGTLALVGTAGGFRQTYDVTSLNARIRRSDVPLPIAIGSGGLRYETGGALALRGLAGTIGASRVEQLDAEIVFAPGPTARSASGSAMLALDELFPWAISLPAARDLRSELTALDGTVGVKLTRLAGALAAPESLEMDAVLTPQKVRATMPRLPGSFTLDGGTIRVANRDLAGDGVGIAMQDMRSTVSGSIRAYATPARALDIAIARATIGPRALEWAEDEAGLARGTRLQAPIKLDRAHVRWPAAAPWHFDAAASASFAGDARVEVDLSYRPGSVLLRRLTLKDQDSDASTTLEWQPERASVAFHGFVSGRSIARILTVPPAASGTLRGDFDATVDLVEPVRSRATGKLQGTEVGLPAVFGLPLLIDRMTLIAEGDRVRAEDTALHLAEEPLTLNGSIARAGDGLVVEGDIGAEGVDAERWMDRLRAHPALASATAPVRWPVRGRIGVRAAHVDVLGYRVEPFAAAVVFGDRKVTAEATDARVCGIAVPFTLTATEGAMDLKGRVAVENLPVAAAMVCLTKNLFRASGTMDLDADFAAHGPAASLQGAMQGNARLRARDGRVGGARGLSGVLKLDDVNERLPGAEREFDREGLPYAAIEIDARLAGERALIDRALLESPGLNIVAQGEVGLADRKVALTGIALPIVNSLLRRVPIVGRAVGDPIVGIPFRVSGDLADPQVTKTGATAIAGALVDTLQSVVSLPVQLLGIGAGGARGADVSAPAQRATSDPP
jgi:AsmA-like C-terminal region